MREWGTCETPTTLATRCVVTVSVFTCEIDRDPHTQDIGRTPRLEILNDALGDEAEMPHCGTLFTHVGREERNWTEGANLQSREGTHLLVNEREREREGRREGRPLEVAPVEAYCQSVVSGTPKYEKAGPLSRAVCIGWRFRREQHASGTMSSGGEKGGERECVCVVIKF